MRAVALKLPDLRIPNAVRQHGAAGLVLATAAGLHVIAGASLALSGAPQAAPARADAAIAKADLAKLPARAEPMKLKQVSPTDAVAWNASIPLSDLCNPAARPFQFAAGTIDRTRSLDCLTAAIYYEAAVEPLDGQRAVAQVVLNRSRHPAYPRTVCGVVFEGSQRSTGCQFTFTCDGSLRRTPSAAGWARARQVAEAALNGYVYTPVGWATHYHTNWVVPYWASSLVKAANVGTHIFYRWTGGWGRPAAFTNRHPGAEPAIAWRGGFGQPEATEVADAESAEARDALAKKAAADAAVEAATGHSVDSFQRAVLRRYEPLNKETAKSQIAERVGQNLTNSQRWALTGDSGGSTEQALGKKAEAPVQPTGSSAAASR